MYANVKHSSNKIKLFANVFNLKDFLVIDKDFFYSS